MDIKAYINGLFKNYENSAAMEDFKEELCSNLQERIAYMISKGMSETDAFAKASEELGDITEIANQISAERKKEVIGDMYMGTRNYLTTRHITGYVSAAVILIIGLILALLNYLKYGDSTVLIRVVFPFILISGSLFTYFGLTQETARNYPMHAKRAFYYATSVWLLLLGIMLFIHFALRGSDLSRCIITLVPFALTGGIFLAVLLLTEKNRNKPWVQEQQAIWESKYKEPFEDAYTSAKFGLLSGAIWIFATALFFTLGFLFSFGYSWIIYIFAVGVQLLVQALTMKKED